MSDCRPLIENRQRLYPRRPGLVQAIGLSGQMHGAALLGANDRPLRPAILWNDTAMMVRLLEVCDYFVALRVLKGRAAKNGRKYAFCIQFYKCSFTHLHRTTRYAPMNKR
ncbi:FGGY family carbohydrate kinase [Paraburkholderia terrae]|uniref:FGGY family carbohydrate kinase n=1 Tax=Paraburkholderia terrae TaxID=311230 RepID=UPI0037CC19AE